MIRTYPSPGRFAATLSPEGRGEVVACAGASYFPSPLWKGERNGAKRQGEGS
jgi:hypothetical protein